MALSEVAGVILAAVERHGVLLVHDRVLPSLTAIVTGGPVAGSWWAHPLANTIYNALGEVEDQVATVKLLAGKNTLVAQRLWSDLAGVGLGRDPWQLDGLDGLDGRTLAVLDQIDAAGEPVVLDRSDRRAADSLERRLLVHPTELHTDSGKHLKVHQGWRHWCDASGITPRSDSGRARGASKASPRQGQGGDSCHGEEPGTALHTARTVQCWPCRRGSVYLIDRLIESTEERVRSLVRYTLLPAIVLVIVTLIALAAAVAD